MSCTTVLVDIGRCVDLRSVLVTKNAVTHAILINGATLASEAYSIMLKVE